MMKSTQEIISLINALQLFFDEPTAVMFGIAIAISIVGTVLSRRRRGPNRMRNRGYALNEMDAMDESHFKKMFRMSKNAFKQLVIKLEDYVDIPDEVSAENSAGSVVSMRTRLACALRWLAGGSYLDICFEFGVAPGSFYHEGGVLWGTLEAIDDAFDLYFPFHDDNFLEQKAAEFAQFSHGHLTNCVLAIDGWVCKTRCPTASEVLFPMSYRNRHDCFGIVVLAGCFADLKFAMFSCVSCGSTNDTMAWDLSMMKTLLDKDFLAKKYYFIGDEAFSNRDQFLVPWSGRGLSWDKDSFNYHLSSMRQCIERAFSLLTQRWGIFWRPLRCSYDKWTLVCTVAAKLHNFCIDENEGTREHIAPRYDWDCEEGDDPAIYLNPLDPDADIARATGHRRRNLTDFLQSQGIRRPNRQ